MGYYIVKVLLTSILIVLVSEVAKRSSIVGAILASIPLVSVVAMIWLYQDTGDLQKVRDLAASIVWLVIPSLILFILMPLMIDRGYGFYTSLISGLVAMVASYTLALALVHAVK